MGELVNVLRDGRVVIFGKIQSRCGEIIKDTVVILEGRSDMKGKKCRGIYGITKTDDCGEYYFIISDKNVDYNVAVFEDKYYTVNDVVKFIKN